MTGRRANTSVSDHRTSRRHFFKLLAGSPMLALAYPALSPSWQRSVWRELQRSAPPGRGRQELAVPTAGRRWLTRLLPVSALLGAGGRRGPTAHGALDEHLTGQLVESPEQAINVWDFERVAHANNLPEHWAYIHMGVDDFETRKANREGFQRLMLRPRRLGQDATKLDTSVQLFGRRWDTPLFLCPVAALEAYHTEGESGAARRPRREASCRSSRTRARSPTKPSPRRGASRTGFSSTRSRTGTSTRGSLDKVSAAGCPALVWTIDLLGGSNRELSRRSQGRQDYDRPLCQNCHNHKPGYQRPMHRGAATVRPDRVRRSRGTTSSASRTPRR